jgi:T5SS/PEP-CTERM-associated repeat protein/autotransporter-associated beta strand protein
MKSYRMRQQVGLPAGYGKSLVRAGIAALGSAILFALAASNGWGAIGWTGDVTPTDPNTWTSGTSGTTGYIGQTTTGTVTVDGTSELLSTHCFLGSGVGADGTATISGIGAKWTLGYGTVWVGESGRGAVNVEAGAVVSSGETTLGRNPTGQGNLSVVGANSRWDNLYDFYVGAGGSGKLNVANGGTVSTGSLYASFDDLSGDGTIYARGGVLDTALVFDKDNGSQKSLSFGSGGTLYFTQSGSGDLGAGHKGTGSLRIADGKAIYSNTGCLGYGLGSNGTATITGARSSWQTSFLLFVGFYGSGTLNIEQGGSVSNSNDCNVGTAPGSHGTVNVRGGGSTWTHHIVHVGDYGTGTLNVEDGGQVVSTNCYLAYGMNSTGTATVRGSGSKWTTNFLSLGGITTGYGGTGTLDIGSETTPGGVVKAQTVVLGAGPTGTGTCNLVKGGTLQAGTILRGMGTANFNWDDGTIQNFDTSTDLGIANTIVIQLTAMGTHTFNIDAGRAGAVHAMLVDATNDGSLTKTGLGRLGLTNANTYSGDTKIEAGTLSINIPYLNDRAGVYISSGAKFGMNFSGSDTIGLLYLDGLPAGSGTWGSSQSGAMHIDDVHFMGTGMLNVVPEPPALVLLGIAATVVAGWSRRRGRRVA